MIRALASFSTYERAFLVGLVFGAFSMFGSCASAPTSDRPSRPHPAPEMDADRFPNLLVALQHYKPHLLSARGGYPLLLVVNGGLAEPLENLASIRTDWVVKVVRVNHDVRQVGNVSTLHVTLRNHQG